MSVQRLYSCDLCGTGKGLVGIMWTGALAGDWNSGEGGPAFRDAIRAVPWNSSEHHLCKNCIKDIERLAGEIRP